jgi:putative oxidoreductase
MYFAYISEVVAPILIILGIFTRLSAIALIITLLVAIPALPFDVMALGMHGEWVIEIQLFYLFVPVALLFTGPGRYSLRRNESGNWLLG